MHRLEIRPARPSEYAEIGELTAGTYRGEGFAGEEYAEVLADAAGRAAAPATEVLVARLDNQVAGAVTLAGAGSPYANQAGPGEVELRMLVVAAAVRGQGVAAALVRACLDRATRAGAHAMVLASQDDMLAAARLYARLGFQRTPERDWSPAPGLTLRTYRRGL